MLVVGENASLYSFNSSKCALLHRHVSSLITSKSTSRHVNDDITTVTMGTLRK
ncbi:hypothetical protein YC2023_061893 [Brassica napus]